jgi:serine/threonine protein kinase
VVHRDVKPDNIIIRPDKTVAIIDFGICRKMGERTITNGPGLKGTLQWMAPEQLTNPGTEDPRSDLYSLGAIAYHMLTSQVPIQGDDPGTVAVSICQYVPPSPKLLNPAIPDHVAQACMLLLAKQREARFQTAAEFIHAVSQTGPNLGRALFCILCGASVQPGSRFCHNCGGELAPGQSLSPQCLACGTAVGGSAVCCGCHRPFSHRDHQLVFRNGPLSGRTFRIPEGIYSVGRDELLPRDSHISRKHFSVACMNGSVVVQDAGSTNKTYIGGRIAIAPTALRSGLEFHVAGSTASYSST